MSPHRAAVLAFLLLLLFQSAAAAHSATLVAKVGYDPSKGGSVRVELLDPYGNPVPDARVRAALWPFGQKVSRWTDLKEVQKGVHGEAWLGVQKDQVLHLLVEWAGEKMEGQMAVDTEQAMEGISVDLVHIEADGQGAGQGWWRDLIIPGAGLIVIAAVWFSLARKGAKK